MNYYKVRLTRGSTTLTQIIEADSIDDVWRTLAHISESNLVSIGITRVREYQVTWTQHNICTVFAASETEAFDAAAEYAEDHDTGDDYNNYEIIELDTTPEIEVSAALVGDYERRAMELLS